MALGKESPQGESSVLRTRVQGSRAAGEPGWQAGMALHC